MTIAKARPPARWPRIAIPRGLWVIPLLLLATFTVGLQLLGPSRDWATYESLFEWARTTQWSDGLVERNPIYYGGMHLAAKADLNFSSFLLIVAGLGLALKARVASRLDTHLPALLLLYFSYIFWLHDYTQTRLALAMGLLLTGMYSESRWRWLWYALAASVHETVLIVVLVRWIAGHTRIALGLAILLTPVVRPEWVRSTILSRVDLYLDLLNSGNFDTLNPFSLMPIIQLLTLLVSVRTIRKSPPPFQMEALLSLAGLIAFYSLAFIPVLAFRTYELFMPFFLILVSRLWMKSKRVCLLGLALVALGFRTTFFSVDSLLLSSGT